MATSIIYMQKDVIYIKCNMGLSDEDRQFPAHLLWYQRGKRKLQLNAIKIIPQLGFIPAATTLQKNKKH